MFDTAAPVCGHSLIGGAWQPGDGLEFVSTDPTGQDELWRGHAAGAQLVDDAVAAAAQAGPAWVARGADERHDALARFVALLETEWGDRLATSISREAGKPAWEARTEVASVRGKLAASARAFAERAAPRREPAGAAEAVTLFRPLGVVAVLGPFNFPAHMPNGHIMPALLAGNTVVFKPSQLTPGVGEVYVAAWQAAGLPPGVLNLVQGGAETGAALTAHPRVDGVCFNGSRAAGLAINRAAADEPEKLLVLEMGGNNPLVVWDYEDVRAATQLVVQSCYVTAGQRCTAARRLIVRTDDAGLLDGVATAVRELRVGRPGDDPQPYMGPVVSKESAARLLEQQQALLDAGATAIVEMHPAPEGLPYLLPGLVDVTDVQDVPDDEIFGPLLQVQRVVDFDAAVAAANATLYGLASGIVCRDRSRFDEFCGRVRTGIVNWNQQLTGASGLAPFGGRGASGNHRPSGFMAVDYCSDAIGSMQTPDLEMPDKLPPGLFV